MNLFNKNNTGAEKPKYQMTQSQSMIRMLAGGYLLYLTYSVISSGGLKSNTGWKLALMILALVAFVGFGIYWIIEGFKNLSQASKAVDDTAAEETAEELPEAENMSEAPGDESDAESGNTSDEEKSDTQE